MILAAHVFRLGIFLLLAFFSLNPAPVARAAEKTTDRVAFLPFEVHASTDLSYLQEGIRDMLASRLAANADITPIDRNLVEQARMPAENRRRIDALRDLGQKLGADYLIAGSLTALGGSMSLDTIVLPLTPGAAPVNFYATAASESEVIPAIDSLALDIAARVFGEAATQPARVTAAPTGATPTSPENPFQTVHPERMLMKPEGSGSTPALVRPSAGNNFRGFVKSRNFDLHLQAMDVADVDGDGSDEIVAATINEIVVFKRQGGQLRELGRTQVTSGTTTIHMISCADLNMNGRAEIYVSAADKFYPASLGLEWEESGFRELFKNAAWYIKAMELPGEGHILAGQRSGTSEALRPGVFRLERQATVLQPERKLALPDYINLFDFAMADLDGDGAAETIGITQTDRLFVLQANGSLAWRSEEYFGGTTRYVGEEKALERQGLDLNSAPPDEIDTNLDEENTGRIYIPSRIITTDINNDGLVDVVINRNLSKASRVMETMKNFRSGEIYGLAWNGLGLTEVWHTRKIDGYIADYQMRPDPARPANKILYVGVVLGSGWFDIFSSADSTVLIYDLDFGQNE